jgi:HPt (histidine-containing phosphotransfer) domain-containing protein
VIISPSASAAERIDRAVLDEFYDTTGDEVFREIGVTFTEQISLLITALKAAVGAQDSSEVERITHELAGAAGTFGADALTDRARNATEMCRTGQEAAAFAGAADICMEARATLVAFKAYLAALP